MAFEVALVRLECQKALSGTFDSDSCSLDAIPTWKLDSGWLRILDDVFGDQCQLPGASSSLEIG